MADCGGRRERDGWLAVLPLQVAATYDGAWVRKPPSQAVSGSPEHMAAERAAAEDRVHDDRKHPVRGRYGY